MHIDCCQGLNEVFLECCKCVFSGIDKMVVQRDQLDANFSDLIYFSTANKHSLSITLRVGVYPPALSQDNFIACCHHGSICA